MSNLDLEDLTQRIFSFTKQRPVSDENPVFHVELTPSFSLTLISSNHNWRFPAIFITGFHEQLLNSFFLRLAANLIDDPEGDWSYGVDPCNWHIRTGTFEPNLPYLDEYLNLYPIIENYLLEDEVNPAKDPHCFGQWLFIDLPDWAS